MAESTQTISIAEGAGHVFDHLKDVDQMHRYVDVVESAELTGGDAVRIRALIPEQGSDDADRTTVEGDGWFRADEDARRIEWGVDGPHDYHGWLQVTGDEQGCEVEVRISTQRVDDDALDDELRRAMEGLRDRLQSGVEGPEPGPRHQSDQVTAADAGLAG